VTSFGGHVFAVGLKIKKSDFENFRNEFNKVVAANLTKEEFIKTQDVDAKIDLGKIDRKFLSVLSQMEPFGNSFMKPVFETIVKIKDIKILKREHVSLLVEQNGVRIKCIGFFMRELFCEIKKNFSVKLFYNIQVETFNNSFHLIIKNILPVTD
jgi:single-stranded-DNA-specific exonuclease